MKVTKVALLLAGVSIIPLTSGCMTMLAKMAVGLATDKTSDLSVCALQAKYMTNLYPKEAKTFEIPFYAANWEEGSNMVTVTCTARTGIKLYEIEGTVQVDGEPMDYVSGGTYAKNVGKGQPAPKKVSIVTATGQKAEFTVQPIKSAQLVSVNGNTSSAQVDVSKDMTLAFKDIPSESSLVRVSIITESAGMRNFASIGSYKLDKVVKIPAAAFKHPMLFVTSGSKLSVGTRTKGKTLSASSTLVKDGNYVFVETYEAKNLAVAGVPAAEQVGLGWTWMPIDVKGDAEAEPGIMTSGTTKTAAGDVDYFISKPNASLGKPFSKAKKFALTSMSVHGPMKVVTVKEASVSSALETKKYDFNGQQMEGAKDVTSVWQFPKVPIEYWDSEMDRFTADMGGMLKDEFGITLVPLDVVMAAKTYQDLTAAEDEYTEDKINRPYKNTRPLIGSRVGSATFGSDQTEVQLMDELGVDGLLAMDVEIGLPTETKGKDRLSTTIHFRMIGRPNDYSPRTTTYAEGEVSTVKGIDFVKDEFTDDSKMSRVMRRTELMKVLTAALKEQEAKAKTLGYEAIWQQRSIDSAHKDRSVSQILD